MAQPRISSATRKRIREHLQQHWTQPRTCPICGANAWHVQSGGVQWIGEESEDDEDSYEPSGLSVATVQVVCKNCFYFHSFLLLPMKRKGR